MPSFACPIIGAFVRPVRVLHLQGRRLLRGGLVSAKAALILSLSGKDFTCHRMRRMPADEVAFSFFLSVFARDIDSCDLSSSSIAAKTVESLEQITDRKSTRLNSSHTV